MIRFYTHLTPLGSFLPFRDSFLGTFQSRGFVFAVLCPYFYNVPADFTFMDVHDQKTRSYNMSRIKGKNTKPEMLVRRFNLFW
jgi:DNA mismatch endonuclease (patch repair protein)